MYPEIPPQNTQANLAFGRRYAGSSNNHHSHRENDNLRSQKSYSSYRSQTNSHHHSRLQSQAKSHDGSYSGSIAENLDPSNDPSRVKPSPQFGRYSGGFSYAYEHGSDFGGSAGTRSVSGVVGVSRMGKKLSQTLGVDLSNVPIIPELEKP